jgi:NAD(P)-dependent dehydrogenase (short-subunit alcohol dehydrogenase family)
MSAPNSDSHPQHSHAGRVAVVTGAARGIGQAMCNALAERGADVVGVDVGELHQTGKLVVDHGSRWLGVLLDITDVAAVARLTTTVAEEFGRVDILVNNAAIDDPIGWDELDLDRWRSVLCVDLEAPFLLCKAFIPLMAARGWGRIVNIGSGSVENPMSKFVAYRSAKMGVIGFSRALATEVGSQGITVNVVSPGITRTAMVESSLPAGALQAAAQTRAIKRVAEPVDIAGAVLFLTSPDSAFITGQTVLVNGGACFG